MDCTGIVKVFDNQDRIVWRYIEGSDWEYYYAEEATYIFRKVGSSILHIVAGRNPRKAFDKLIAELTRNGG